MKARSLVFDLFGDYLRYRGGAVRLRGLVALMGCFDVPEATVRVVVTRLRDEGWLQSRRDGRETSYLLTPAARRLLDEGRDRLFRRADVPWDRQWRMIIYSAPETERAARDQLRRTLSGLGFGQLAPAVWICPHDRVRQVEAAVDGSPAVRLDVFRCRSLGLEADRQLAGRAWDLTGLERGYDELLTRYRPRLERYRAGELAGRDALVERMSLIQDYRLFPLRDPDLPAELLPANWSGHDAHEVFLTAHTLLEAPADDFVGALIATAATRSRAGRREVG